jgi:hypothetical protein
MEIEQEPPVVQEEQEATDISHNEDEAELSLETGWGISVENRTVIFTCSGDEDTVRKYVRELLILTDGSIRQYQNHDTMLKNFAQYDVLVYMNDNDALAQVFWFIGKVSNDHFHSPEDFRYDYRDITACPHDMQTKDKSYTETLGYSLARAVEKAIARKDVELVMKVDTLTKFRRHQHRMTNWEGLMTNREMKEMEDSIAKSATANLQNMQQPAQEESVASSIFRFFSTTAASIGQFFSSDAAPPEASEDSHLLTKGKEPSRRYS